jgi:hypothetical protein
MNERYTRLEKIHSQLWEQRYSRIPANRPAWFWKLIAFHQRLGFDLVLVQDFQHQSRLMFAINPNGKFIQDWGIPSSSR